jgi:hypothetical protein
MGDDLDFDYTIKGLGPLPRRARKEPAMTKSAADQQLAERLAAARLEEELARKTNFLADLGADTFDEHTVIRFDKILPSAAARVATVRTYTYAAIKVDGHWYLTGTIAGRYTWDELMLFLVSGPEPTTTFEVLALA